MIFTDDINLTQQHDDVFGVADVASVASVDGVDGVDGISGVVGDNQKEEEEVAKILEDARIHRWNLLGGHRWHRPRISSQDEAGALDGPRGTQTLSPVIMRTQAFGESVIPI